MSEMLPQPTSSLPKVLPLNGSPARRTARASTSFRVGDQDPESLGQRLARYAFSIVVLGEGIYLVQGAAVTSAGLGSWIASLGGVMLLVGAASHTVMMWAKLPSSFRLWLFAALTIVLWMECRGAIDGLFVDPLYFAYESLPWLCLALLPALASNGMPSKLVKTFEWHTIAGAIWVAVSMVANWSLVTGEVVDRDQALEARNTLVFLYALPFVLFDFWEMSKAGRIAGVLGLAMMGLLWILAGLRQGLFLLGIILVLSIWSINRSRQTAERGRSQSFAKVLASAALLVVLWGAGDFLLSRMTGAMDLFSTRVELKSGEASLRENARWDELRQLGDQFDWGDFVFGRGTLGSFENTAAPKQDSVHIGWGRCILKGGVLLLVVLLAGPPRLGVRQFFRLREARSLACAAICVLFIFKNTSGNGMLGLGWYLTAVCFGHCFFIASQHHQRRRLAQAAPGSNILLSPARLTASPMAAPQFSNGYPDEGPVV